MSRLARLPIQRTELQGGARVFSRVEPTAAADRLHAADNARLLRIEEAADWLALSKRKTYELLSRGEIPSVYIGRSRRITVAALQQFVERLSEDRD